MHGGRGRLVRLITLATEAPETQKCVKALLDAMHAYRSGDSAAIDSLHIHKRVPPCRGKGSVEHSGTRMGPEVDLPKTCFTNWYRFIAFSLMLLARITCTWRNQGCLHIVH